MLTQPAPFRFAIEFFTETMPGEEVTVEVFSLRDPDQTTCFRISNPRATAVVATLMNR